MQAGLHGFFAKLQPLARLERAHIVDEPRHNHRPVGLWKTPDRGMQNGAQLGSDGLLFRVHGKGALHTGPALIPGIVGGLQTSPAAQTAEGFVDADAAEPSCELRASGELIEMSQRAEMGLLNDIFRFRLVAYDAIN